MRRGGSTLVHLVAPPPPQIQKLANRSDVISVVPKCSKIKIFWGSAPTPLGELTMFSHPHPPVDGDEARFPLSRTPPPLSGLVSTGLRV